MVKWEKSCERLVPFIEVEDRVGNLVELGGRKFRVNGQTEDTSSEVFGNRKIPGLVPHITADSHEMDWHGIVNCAADSGLFKVLAQLIAFVRQYNEGVIYTEFTGCIRRTTKAGTSVEPAAIVFRIGAAASGDVVEVTELNAQHGCLNRSKPGKHAA